MSGSTLYNADTRTWEPPTTALGRADLQALTNDTISPNGGNASQAIAIPASPLTNPGQVRIAQLAADWGMIRAAQCKVDGLTDDAPMVNAWIGAQVAAQPGSTLPRVTIRVPDGQDMFLGSPINTQGAWTTIIGGGKYSSRLLMIPGGAGLIVHGTQAAPAYGALVVKDLGLWDLRSSGSGVPAISAYFDWTKLQPWTTATMSDVVFRSFTQAVTATDMARDALFTNVTSYGPDFGITSTPAFFFTTSAANTFGSFTFSLINCRSVNHSFLVGFAGAEQLEGPRLYACTAYSGIGLIRAAMPTSPASMPGVTTYQSPIWSMSDCDWQGIGPSVDVVGLSAFTMTGGFHIANQSAFQYSTSVAIASGSAAVTISGQVWWLSNWAFGISGTGIAGGTTVTGASYNAASGVTTLTLSAPTTAAIAANTSLTVTFLPVADPTGAARTHRSYFHFQRCDGVYLDRIRMDTSSYMEASATLCRVSNDTTHFFSEKAHVQSAGSIAGCWEYDAGGTTNRCKAFDTQYAIWNGGQKVIEDGTQVNQEAVYDPQAGIYLGNVDRSGYYDLRLKFLAQTADNNNRIAVTLPTRPAGHQIFNGGQPEALAVELLNGTGAAAPAHTLYNVTATGITIQLAGSSSNFQADVWVRVGGY